MKACAKHIKSAIMNATDDLINNWNDGNNFIFYFWQDNEQAVKFRRSKRVEWIRKHPLFSSLVMSDAFENLDHTEWIAILMAAFLETSQNEASANAVPRCLK